MGNPKYYECSVCGSIHKWDWRGDCREDGARFFQEQLDAKHGHHGYDLLSMDERVAADEDHPNGTG